MTPSPFLHGPPSPHQRLPPRQTLRRHRHTQPYAAVVLAGSYEEAGDEGRRHLRPGDVVLHGAFGAHGNRVGRQGAELLNLPWTGEHGGEPSASGFAQLHDLDAVARLAAFDPVAAEDALRHQLRPLPPMLLDWPDLLARDLAAEPGLALMDWASARGLAAETLSRGFTRVFGVTPRRWRFELRARRAMGALIGGREPLAGVALAAGFADQAHLTHAVVELTGRAPGHWRRASSGDKTTRGGAGSIGG